MIVPYRHTCRICEVTDPEGTSHGHGATEGLSFGAAIDFAKTYGKRIARAGWNGKGMWVAYMPPAVIPEGMVNGRTKKYVPTGDLNVGGYLVLWTAQGVWQPGWLASQADILAEDWSVVL